MAFAALQIVHLALAVVGASPAPATPPVATGSAIEHLRDAEVASLYDQATCAIIYGDADDWARAAIGEDEVPPLLPSTSDEEYAELPRPAPSTACSDRSFGQKWRELLVACSARNRELSPCAGLRVGRPARPLPDRRGDRARLTTLATSSVPLAPSPEERDTPRALLHDVTSRLAPPICVGLLVADAPAVLRSVPSDELLRPPRA